MSTSELRDGLEARQVWIYFAAVLVVVRTWQGVGIDGARTDPKERA